MSDCPKCGHRLPRVIPPMKPTCKNCGYTEPRRTWAQIKKDWGK